jgi:hypothetical protein
MVRSMATWLALGSTAPQPVRRRGENEHLEWNQPDLIVLRPREPRPNMTVLSRNEADGKAC